MQLVSKPSRRVYMDNEEVRRFIKGSRVKFVPGLTLGEVALIRAGDKWLEGRDAVSQGLGGEVIARVSG